MKHIEINKDIIKIAKDFRTDLETKKSGYIPPKDKLQVLYRSLKDPVLKKYVKMIHRKWSTLVIVTPDQWEDIIKEFEDVISETQLATISINGVKFHEIIEEAMRYDRVQSHVFPKCMKKLGIRTCVYCNAQYTYYVEGEDENYQNYDIDHLLPQSKYPYLCTSFFNLQPSCPSCNRKKSDRKQVPGTKLFQLYVPQGSSLNPALFHLDALSLAQFLQDGNKDAEILKILFSCPNDRELENGFNYYFHISTLYQAHTDIAEELVWKSRIYNKTYQDFYIKQFKQLGFKGSDFTRFIIGNYDTVENIHKRPLSKMTQDIAEQLGIIKKQK